MMPRFALIRRVALAIGVAVASSIAIIPASADELATGTCSWLERSDPALLNVLYPDESAVYYVARLPMPPPGLQYEIRGEFPHARYMSFVSYNGLPMDALLDEDIPADTGSVNPFVPHADRTAESRSYTVRLVPEPAPADPAGRAAGALYVGGGQLGTPAPSFTVFYRVYVPDKGTDLRGGVPLPVIEVVGTGVDADLTPIPCEDLRDELATLPLDDVQDRYAETAAPVTAPVTPSATNPPTWTVETGLTAALLGRVGQGDLVSGGPASNPHNRYVAAPVNRSHGEVLAIRGKAPATPKTYLGEPRVGRGDLRYWSFCQNSRSTRYVDCLSDVQVQLDEDGYYTIAISDPANRPASARNWLPFGPEPDGQLIYRHMLPSEKFYRYSAHGIAVSGEPIEDAMGDYYPRAVYCTASQFDANTCGLRAEGS